jgi:hypothetical protein
MAAIGGMAVVPAHADVASSTISGTLDVRAQTGARHLVIKVNTLGGPPVATKSQPIWLVNDQGFNRSSAWILDSFSSPCQSAQVHFVPVGPAPYTANQNWCLDITLPEYGSQVTGVLHGASATIGISVEHQTGWGWPILCALLGLGVALSVVLLSSANIPNLAPSLSPGVRLRRIVRKARKKDLTGLTKQWRRRAIKVVRSSGPGANSHRMVTYLGDVIDHRDEGEDKALEALEEALAEKSPSNPPPPARPRQVAWRWAVALFELIPMLVAGATAVVSVYLTNKTFGTWSDFLALGLATAGTSAAAAAAAALVRALGSTPSTP